MSAQPLGVARSDKSAMGEAWEAAGSAATASAPAESMAGNSRR
jgi:hypothetical protein